ncbi:MAG: hypothetical protein IJ411_05940 [Oscillospiraceae bacterium]|nr:hypothetical protein [Oscillospiraceae bacterium]
MRCPNCGAEYDDLEVQCPFCKTFNYQGAENQYMEKLEEIRSNMEELNDVPITVYKREVKQHLNFSAKVVGGILLAVLLLFSFGWAVNACDARLWKQDHQKILQWYDTNLPQMNRWYEAGDLEALSTFHQNLSEEEYTAFYSWDHADVIFSYECWKHIEAVYEALDKGEEVEAKALSGAMYDAFSLIFFPGNDFVQDREQELLAEFQSSAWLLLTEHLGFTKESAERFYEENSQYDALVYSSCEDYVTTLSQEG